MKRIFLLCFVAVAACVAAFALTPIDNSQQKFKTSLEDLQFDAGTWIVSDNGLTSRYADD